MSEKTNPYSGPMEPYPGLEAAARSVGLIGSGLRLHLYETGRPGSPPVVLIHGLGDEADTWRHLFSHLSPAVRLVAPDLPGFGRSSGPASGATVPALQAALIELLDVLKLERPLLVGHSMGAMLVHSIALQHPERVRGLVLIGGSLVVKSQKLNLATLMFLVPGLGEWAYNRLRKDPKAAYQSLEPYYAHLERLPEVDRLFLYQRVNQRVWSDTQRTAFLSALRSLAQFASSAGRRSSAQLAGLEVPTLAFWGEADHINSPENGRALAAIQRNVRLAILPGAGHNLHQERPETIAEAIESLLAKTH